MDALTVIERLRDRGVELKADDDMVRYRPADALSAEDLDALRQHKPEVLLLLTPWTQDVPAKWYELRGRRPPPLLTPTGQRAVMLWVKQGRPALPLVTVPGVIVDLRRCLLTILDDSAAMAALRELEAREEPRK